MAAFVLGLGSGCKKNLGVSPMQMLESRVPQSVQLELEADELLAILAAEARAYGDCGMLASSLEAGVISWCESVVDWRDLSQDSVSHAHKSRGATEEERQARRTVVEKGIAITTAWVTPTDTGSELTLRRVYFGRESFTGPAHSRGVYERDLLRRIERRTPYRLALPARAAGATDGTPPYENWLLFP